MKIHVNGEAVETGAGTVQALIAELDLSPATALVEHNQTALLRSEWSSTNLSEGDQIEILCISAGG